MITWKNYYATLMAGLAVKTLRPAGEGRAVEGKSKENDKIIKAAREGDIDTLVSMSHSGIDVTTARSRNVYQETPMHIAAENNQVEIIKILSDNGAAVDAKDILQQTPMHKAAQNDQVEIIKILSDNGAAVDAKDQDGSTPLHWAAYNGQSSAVETLVDIGAKVDIKDNNGITPLADAVKEGHGDVVKLLVRKHKANTAKVPERLQQKMKELLGEDASTHDSQQVHTDETHPEEATDPKAVELAYKQAVKQGVNEANQFKIVTLGAEGAGKTSTICSLLDMEFQPDLPSTVGADSHTVDICNTFTADRVFVCNWKTREFQHHLNSLSICYKHEMKEDMTKTLTKISDSKSFESIRLKEQQSKGKEYDEVSRSAGLEVLKYEVTPDGKIRIVIYDLGGQEVYYEVHYLFLASHDVVFLTFNASVSLDKPVVRRHRHTVFQKEYKTRETLTTYEIIEATLHTIYSHCGIDGGNFSPRNPIVIMIATHSCNLTEDEKRTITDTLFSRLPSKLCDHFPTEKKDAIHFIDNKERDPEAFNHLRAVAVKAAEHTLAEKRPIAYLKFEENILTKSRNKTELTKENALHIAKKAGLEPTNEALLAVLQYFSVRGVLLYYPDVEALKNTIFISPQWVSDLVTCVIKTHNYAEPRPTAELHKKCIRFDKFGLLEEALLDDMLKRSGYSKHIVLALLKKFELAIEINRGIKFENEAASYVTPNDGRVFFVPSMLVHNTTQDYVPSKDCISNIVLYHFPDKFIPVAVFNRVLILVIKWCNAEDHRIRCIFNGIGVFDFSNDNKQSFMLKYSSCTYSIEVHIWVRKQELYNIHLWQQRKNLLELMQVSINTAHCHCMPKATEPIAYVECPLYHDEEYDPHIRLDAIKAKTLCTIVNEYILEDTYKLLLKPINQCATNISAPRQLVRGAVSIDQIRDKHETPQMRDLHHHVIPQYATKWRVVGLELNLKTTTLDTISKDFLNSCVACFEKTLDTWLQSNPEATWRILEVAITNAIRACEGLGPVTDIYVVGPY